MKPVFNVYRPASPKPPRLGWNRYFEGTPDQVTIGAYAVAFGRCFALQWRRP
jgi:hypothetical protein